MPRSIFNVNFIYLFIFNYKSQKNYFKYIIFIANKYEFSYWE